MRKIIKPIVICLIVIMVISAFFCIFKLAYTAISDANNLEPLKYSDFIVIENNMTPTYNVNDLVICERFPAYSIGDKILYESNAGLRLGQINDISGGYYIITDNIKDKEHGENVKSDKIKGKIVLRIKKFAGLYSVITSPYFLIASILVVICCSVFIPKEKSVM